MKNRIKTNNLRTIKKALPRFISLIIMSLLGVFVFSGLQATSPDMLKTLDDYLDKYNTYDIKIISYMGLIDEDIEELEKIEGVHKVEPSYSKDIIIKLNEIENVIKVASLPKEINQLELIDGSFPEKTNEIVVEANMLSKNNLKIGDTITLDDDVLKNKEVTIVGTVDSSLYFNNVELSQTRGNTSIGAGKVNYYAYMPSENFDQSYYSEIYVTVQDTKEELTSSEKYISLVNSVIDKIEEIKHPRWYIYDRTDDSTYSDYIDDSTSIANLSKIFPIVFFSVAVLVSLISMNRMVEEDRLEIGTLKSLGFSNKTIMSKYLLFSFLATVVGGIIGSALGLVIIPLLIFSIYGMLFEIPNFAIGLNLFTTILGFIIVVICVCGTSVITVDQVLKEKPSNLMRPKAPKNGKRVFLENIKFIWNKIKFSQKVTIRNLFRYKKRVLVTVVGISGCTALMLCGFGVRDAIINIADMQYEETFKFDVMTYVSDLNDEDIKEIYSDEKIVNKTKVETISSTVKDKNVNLFVIEDSENMENVVNLVDSKTKTQVQLEKGKVVITDKFADLIGVNVGDSIEILDVNNNSYSYEISAIVKNYLEHFIYIDKDTFESSGQRFEPNVMYLNTVELSNEERQNLATQLLENDKIINVTFSENLIESAQNMLTSLNQVVVILIILAAMLAFVVLYNLSNININERKREIATLKVLGFYDKEVDNYITKETIILTIIGIAIGLILGYFLTATVITSVEIEKARFIHNISTKSYIYSACLSALFTLIVNIITHFNLKKINMIDSLKSVE